MASPEAAKKKTRSDTPARERTSSAASDESADQVKSGDVDEIEALSQKLASARASIGLRTAPITTIRLSTTWLLEFSVRFVGQVIKSPFTWLLIVPAVSAWAATKYSLAPELYSPPVCGEKDGGVLWQVELAIVEAVWWIVLGILSSVGFGTGLHSGIMFLFPHVMQVVGAAEACQTTTGLIGWYQHPCKLDCATTSGPKDSSTVTVFQLWTLVTVQCMLWGLGTAIGELPPYLVSKAARQAGSKDSDYQAELDDARQKTDMFSKMKMWTIDFTEKHGFLGVFLLASWPNAAFDMCGMCCGYVLMPFWTFFLATCLGKGVVKVNLQALVFINVFGSAAFQVLLSGLDSINSAVQSVSGRDIGLRSVVESGRAKLVHNFEQQSRFHPDKLFRSKGELALDDLKQVYSKHSDGEAIASRVLKEWDANADGRLTASELTLAASRTDGKVSLSSLDPGTGTSVLKMLWELFIVGLVLFFLFSVLDQIARTKQQELDDAEIERFSQAKKLKKQN